MSEPTVTVAVLNYDGVDHLGPCFASLSRLDYPGDRLDLMLVDNASDDSSVEFMRREFPGVRVVVNPRNVGFAAGNNVAAREASGEYVVFLNNDMVVDEGFVRGLLEPLSEGPDVVATSAKILSWDGGRFDFAGAICNFAGHAAQVGFDEPYDPGKYASIAPLLFASGGAMLVDRQVFLEAGGFDEEYFIYFEDVDLGWRLWALGHRILYAPEAVAYHRHHGTMSSFADHRKVVLYVRNAMATVLKNAEDDVVGRLFPAALLAAVTAPVDEAVGAGALDLADFEITARSDSTATVTLPSTSAAHLVAAHALARSLPELLEKRRRVQAERRRSDAEIASLFRPFFPPSPWRSAVTAHRIFSGFDLAGLFASAPRKVLVFSPDLVPLHGLPAVGSGLRAWGLAEGLKAAGHDVVLSVPRPALEGADGALPDEVGRVAYTPGAMEETLDAVEPDVVVVSGWPVAEHLFQDAPPRVPLVVDQHGPHLHERSYQGLGSEQENRRRKLGVLRRADYFLCAGELQLEYFRTLLRDAGWSDGEIAARSASVPFSLSPELPERRPAEGEPTFVFGGVWLPWQDPSVSLTALVEELERRDWGRLEVYGGPHPWIPIESGPLRDLVTRLEGSPRVTVHGMLPREELLERYAAAHVAVDLMAPNPERRLAFTSRTVEYLWCGLPVIHNDYAELARYIGDADAGWTIDPEDPDALRAVLAEIHADPAVATRKGENAQRLVRERLTWERTVEPLDEAVRRATLRPGAPEHRHDIRPAGPPRPPTLAEKIRYVYSQAGARGLVRKAAAVVARRRAGAPSV